MPSYLERAFKRGLAFSKTFDSQSFSEQSHLRHQPKLRDLRENVNLNLIRLAKIISNLNFQHGK